MKTIISVLFNSFFLLHVSLFAQIDEWTPATPLSDSVTDNRNAIVAELEFYGGWDHYVIWEKSFDSSSTHIYTRKYYFQNDPVAIVEGDYHNVDPCILRIKDGYYNPPDGTSFYLVYLSDRYGDFDIYYRIYSDDEWSEEFILADTPGEEKHLRSNSASGLTWDYEVKIMYTSLRKENNGPFYFTAIITVDSINCLNPVLEPVASFNWGERYLAWEKETGDSSKVLMSEYDYASDTWAAPEMIYDTGHCTNLRFEESTASEVWPTLTWDVTGASGQNKLVCYDPEWMDFFMINLSQQQEYMPTVFNIFVGVSEIWFYALLSFIKDEDGQTDIYGGYQTEWNPYSYTNLSQSSAFETNPHLWNGIIYYAKQDVINIWESHRNGYWQLWTSKIQVPISGSVAERNENYPGALNAFPNPFLDQVTLTFHSESAGQGSIVLYNAQGQQVGILLKPDLHKGEQSWVLNVAEKRSQQLSSGIYYIKLSIGNISYSTKIIRL